MVRRLFRCGVTIALVVLSVWLFTVPATAQNAAAAAQAVPTTRTSDGKPDLSGFWGGGGGGQGGEKPDEKGNLKFLQRGRPCSPLQAGTQECAPGVNFERDSGIRQRMNPNKPLYKPEFWERVQYLDLNGNAEDPGFGCYPLGVPRMGAPTKIVHIPGREVILLYNNKNTFRVIPVDGRPHDPINSLDQTWRGDAIGTWEGDTLVVDVVGLTGETWLAWPGYFHTNNMHVVERFTRQGNTLTWQATVEDPEVLMKPWVMSPVTLRLNPNPKAFMVEDLPCEERDLQHMVTKERG